MEDQILTVSKKLNEEYLNYDRKFGKSASEKIVPLVDPLNVTLKDMQEAIQKLQNAIRTNQKLPEKNPDMTFIY